MNLIGKKIIATSHDDIRFMRGENVMDSFNRSSSYGGKLTLYFEDKTYMTVDLVQPPNGEHMLACLMGHWEERDNTMVIID